MLRTAQKPPVPSSLIGAHGLFWNREEIDWQASRGRTFQMLGRRGEKGSALQVCDFRKARGVYVLFNDYGPTYVGRARGKEGFGERLRSHDRDEWKDWSRFCWYAFDQVESWTEHKHWSRLVLNEAASDRVSTTQAIDELEALMISAFGLKSQNQMKLGGGKSWVQSTYRDWGFNIGALRNVDRTPVKDTDLREYFTILDDGV